MGGKPRRKAENYKGRGHSATALVEGDEEAALAI